ncbi:hypothetical protein ACLM5H_04880 [Fredinandcohnia humi]
MTLKGNILVTGINREIKSLSIDTPAHADYFNEIYQQLIDNDVTIEQDTAEVVRALRINQINLAMELETLKRATLTGVDANIFVETFVNTEDITLSNGMYDSTNQKIYI